MTTMSGQKRLGEILLERGFLTGSQLAEALEVQARPGEKRLLGQILVARGYVKAAEVKVALAKQKAIPKKTERAD